MFEGNPCVGSFGTRPSAQGFQRSRSKVKTVGRTGDIRRTESNYNRSSWAFGSCELTSTDLARSVCSAKAYLYVIHKLKFGIYCFSAGTWRLHNVASTSMERHDVASRLRRRCINVMCPLGLFYSISILLQNAVCVCVVCVCVCGGEGGGGIRSVCVVMGYFVMYNVPEKYPC